MVKTNPIENISCEIFLAKYFLKKNTIYELNAIPLLYLFSKSKFTDTKTLSTVSLPIIEITFWVIELSGAADE